MKNKSYKLLTATLIALSFSGCNLFDRDSESESDKLPRATQSGKNTFGCLVNGKAWVTETSIDAYAFYQEGVLSITATLTRPGLDQGISFGLHEDNLMLGNYLLADYPDSFGQLGDLISNCGYLTSTNYTGNLSITHFNQVNFIISGTFEFEAYSDDCDEVVKITKGRFDLNYAP